MKKGNSEKKEIAQILFLQGHSQKEIARLAKVSEQTICKWKQEGNWQSKQASLIISKKNRLSELYDELNELNRKIREKTDYKIADSKEADIRRKLIVDIKDLESKYNVSELVSIGRDFISFISEIVSKEEVVPILELYDKFISSIIEKGTWQN